MDKYLLRDICLLIGSYDEQLVDLAAVVRKVGDDIAYNLGMKLIEVTQGDDEAEGVIAAFALAGLTAAWAAKLNEELEGTNDEKDV